MAWSDQLLARYDAATTTSAGVPLSGWTTVRLTGADRALFLHNMCTNDIRSLSASQQTEAFLTDVKGKIVGHVIVLAEPDQLLLLTVPGQAERIMSSLERYIIREDVQLFDDSAYAWALDVGPAAAKHCLGVTRAVKVDCLLAPCLQIWSGGLWIGKTLEPNFPSAQQSTGNDELLWNALRIESGWPLFGVDFDGANLPQEVGRDSQAISFRKGCYLGQETIARIDALGHVNKRLATVKFAGDEPPTPGAEVTADGQTVGHITSACWSPKLGSPIALAMLRRGHNDPGAKLLCDDKRAEVIPTPAVPFLALSSS